MEDKVSELTVNNKKMLGKIESYHTSELLKTLKAQDKKLASDAFQVGHPFLQKKLPRPDTAASPPPSPPHRLRPPGSFLTSSNFLEKLHFIAHF